MNEPNFSITSAFTSNECLLNIKNMFNDKYSRVVNAITPIASILSLVDDYSFEKGENLRRAACGGCYLFIVSANDKRIIDTNWPEMAANCVAFPELNGETLSSVRAIFANDIPGYTITTDNGLCPITKLQGYDFVNTDTITADGHEYNVRLNGTNGLFLYPYSEYQNATAPLPLLGAATITNVYTSTQIHQEFEAIMILKAIPTCFRIYSTYDALCYDYDEGLITTLPAPRFVKEMGYLSNSNAIFGLAAEAMMKGMSVDQFQNMIMCSISNYDYRNLNLINLISAKYDNGASGIIGILRDLYDNVSTIRETENNLFEFTDNSKLITAAFSWSVVGEVLATAGQVISVALFAVSKVLGAVCYVAFSVFGLVSKLFDRVTDIDINDGGDIYGLPYGLSKIDRSLRTSELTLDDNSSSFYQNTINTGFAAVDGAIAYNSVNGVDVRFLSETHIRLTEPTAWWFQFVDIHSSPYTLDLDAMREYLAEHPNANINNFSVPLSRPDEEYSIVLSYITSLYNHLVYDLLLPNSILHTVNFDNMFRRASTGDGIFEYKLLKSLHEMMSNIENSIILGETTYQHGTTESDIWGEYWYHLTMSFFSDSNPLWDPPSHSFGDVLTVENLSQGIDGIPAAYDYWDLSYAISLFCGSNVPVIAGSLDTAEVLANAIFAPQFMALFQTCPSLPNIEHVYVFNPPRVSKRALIKSMLVGAAIIAGASAITFSTIGILKGIRRKSALKHSAECEALWQKYTETLDESDRKAYVKAVKRNNFASIFNGGDKYSKNGFWASTDSSGSVVDSASKLNELNTDENAATSVETTSEAKDLVESIIRLIHTID